MGFEWSIRYSIIDLLRMHPIAWAHVVRSIDWSKNLLLTNMSWSLHSASESSFAAKTRFFLRIRYMNLEKDVCDAEKYETALWEKLGNTAF